MKNTSLRLVGVATCAVLPLLAVAALSAQAAPAPRESVQLRISRDCVATVSVAWANQPTAPYSPAAAVYDVTTSIVDGATTPGPFGTSGSFSITFQMEPTDTPHLIRGALEGVTDDVVLTRSRSVYCAVISVPS